MANLWQTFLARRDDLGVALWQHIEISLIALVIAVVIAIPLAIWAQPHKRMANFVLQLTGVLQTIPSLALLGLLIPFVGIGSVPSVIALVVYALLPIFQNTYVGLDEIDPAYEEAADAFGMSRWQKLRRVELPMAMPVIISGIRTATVLIIGTATLAALVGGGGLGTFILLGINRNDSALTLLGAIASAVLALLFSAGLAFIQKLKWRQLSWLLLAFVVALGGYGGYRLFAPKPETITIAGKLGSEPDILINMYKDLIQQADPNVNVQLKANFGQTSFLYSALKSDKIDIYPEFTGTVLSSFVTPTKAQQQQIAKGADNYPIARDLLAKKDMTLLKPMKYNNTYALVMKRSEAAKYNINTIADLAKMPGEPTAGFDLEFADRQDGYKGIRSQYGLTFKQDSLDASLRYQALNRGQVQLTDGYSTDSQIHQYDLVALRDNRHLFPTYRGAPLMRTQFAKQHPRIVKALNKLAGKISEKQMQTMNYDVNVKQESASSVAKRYLTQHGLLKGGR